MNCPTDGVEVYSASPSSRRLISEVRQDESTGDITAKLDEDNTIDSLEVFNEIKEKHYVTYTEDGRKLVDGKLVDDDSEAPEKMWNKLILNSITGKMSRKDDDTSKSRAEQKEMEETKSSGISDRGSRQKEANTTIIDDPDILT